MKQPPALEEKNPTAKKPLQADWSAYRAAIGSPSITANEWSDEDGVLTFSGITETDGVTFALCEGGTDGTTYIVRNWVTFSNGVKEPFTITLKVDDKVN